MKQLAKCIEELFLAGFALKINLENVIPSEIHNIQVYYRTTFQGKYHSWIGTFEVVRENYNFDIYDSVDIPIDKAKGLNVVKLTKDLQEKLEKLANGD